MKDHLLRLLVAVFYGWRAVKLALTAWLIVFGMVPLLRDAHSFDDVALVLLGTGLAIGWLNPWLWNRDD